MVRHRLARRMTQAHAPLVLRAALRGRTDLGWLDSRHSFSFGAWVDPDRMGVGPLRVLNEDVMAGGAGAGAKAHRGMEVLTYVVEGALAVQDAGGQGPTLRAGEAQVVRAGTTDIMPGEANASKGEPARFLQAWLRPRQLHLPPVRARHAPDLREDGAWAVLAGPGGLDLAADALVDVARLPLGGVARRAVGPGRTGFLHVVDGDAAVSGARLAPGDAAVLPEGEHVVATAHGAHVLFFDLGPA